MEVCINLILFLEYLRVDVFLEYLLSNLEHFWHLYALYLPRPSPLLWHLSFTMEIE